MAIHTCPPPNLEDWLEKYPTNLSGYGHILLEQKKPKDIHLLNELKAYFESAHLDARIVFHDFMGIDLHPDATSDSVEASYPSSLHLTTKKGFFGEVLSGLVVESCELTGKHNWQVPVFLFRFHEDAKKYLYTLVRDVNQKRQTIGRLGTDFIGISVDDDGKIKRLISGEAKWRKELTQGTVDSLMLGPKIKGSNKRKKEKGVWAGLNKEVNPPSGLRELQIILKELDPDKYAETILSMDKLLLAKNSDVVPKTNMILIVGKASAAREKGECYIEFEKIPEAYTAGNDLQVVEVVLSDGEDLIEELYQSLWKGED